MKNKIYVLIALTVSSFWFVQSCKKGFESVQLKAEKLVLPENPDEYYGRNSLLNKQATIGRVLFYDKNLSATNTVACASCHFQENAFADGKQFSGGFKTELTERNSMAFNNLDLNEGFFWDLREVNLKEMVLKPVSNHIEMGFTDISTLSKKLSQFPHYQKLFTEVYIDGLTVPNISNSIAKFLEAIQSNNSKFDNSLDKNTPFNWEKDFTNFSSEENRGKQLFIKDGCMNCHHPMANFQKNWNNWGNIGLDLNYADKGMNKQAFEKRNGIIINGEFDFEGNFKIPSLRNIALTAPYMHDGRFANLNEVLNHYSEVIKNHKNLSWELIDQDLSVESNSRVAKRFNYTEEDKKAIIAFLNTLTDFKMISDPKFSNPFQVEN